MSANALMLRIINSGAANPSSSYRGNDVVVSSCSLRLGSVRLPISSRRFASFTVQSVENASSEPSVSSNLNSTVGSSPLSSYPLQWTVITQRHIHFLSFIACTAAISATWLFCSAIPTLLAFKRAAESMEKLMDVTREELPDTMAAVRLSGMEISDLTMELSDIGKEITQGVKSSTRAVRVAEERLRRLTKTNTTVLVQEVGPREARASDPALAKTARGVREGIVKGRAALQTFFALTRYSKVLFNLFRSRAKA